MSDIAQVLGITLVLGIAACALYVAADPVRWWSTGRIALAILGTYQIVFAFSRVMRWQGWWTPDEVFVFNTLMAGAFCAILVNLVAINWLWKRYGLPIPEGGVA